MASMPKSNPSIHGDHENNQNHPSDLDPDIHNEEDYETQQLISSEGRISRRAKETYNNQKANRSNYHILTATYSSAHSGFYLLQMLVIFTFFGCILYLFIIQKTPRLPLTVKSKIQENQGSFEYTPKMQEIQQKNDPAKTEDGNGKSIFDALVNFPQKIFGGNDDLNSGGVYSAKEIDYEMCAKQTLFEIKTDLNIPDLYKQIEFPKFNSRGHYTAPKAKRRQVSKKGNLALTNSSSSRYNQDKLKIFVVLHSHNDPGWGETFEDYFEHRTKNILDNLLKHLTEDPELKFIWSETCFFDLWWSGLTTEKRNGVKKLVENKQLEFVGGGWVMPDEATPHYLSMVTQLIEGHHWLQQHLNYTPRNGWAIDPFGLSSTYSYIIQRSGLKNNVFSRLHYMLQKLLNEQKKAEFYWRQQWDSKGSTDLYCYEMPYGTYDASGTCGFESTSPWYPASQVCRIFSSQIKLEPLASSVDEDIKRRANTLMEQYKKKALLFHTNNLFLPIGADFAWQTYYEWENDIQNLRLIFKYINSNETFRTEIKFATLNEYFDAVHNDLNNNKLTVDTEKGWKTPVFSGDFFTYNDKKLEYWSGFYTSRIFHKTSERQLMTLVRSSQLIYTLVAAEIKNIFGNLINSKFFEDMLQYIVESRRTLSLFQHHDGITGTSTHHVVMDTAIKLFYGMKKCHTVIQLCIHILQSIRQNEGVNTKINTSSLKTELNTITIDDEIYAPTMSKPRPSTLWKDFLYVINEKFPVEVFAVFNSLAKPRKQLVRVKVTTNDVKVLELNNKEISSEIFPVFKFFNKYSQRKLSPSKRDPLQDFHHFELYFIADLGPMEIKHFKIVHDNLNSTSQTTREKSVRVQVFNSRTKFTQRFRDTFNVTNTELTSNGKTKETIRISNHYLTVNFDENGTARNVEMEGDSYPLNITFHYYRTRSSGLYIFMPSGPASPIDLMGVDPVIIVVEGKLRSYVEVWYPLVIHRLILFNHDGLEGYGMHVENNVDIRHQYNYEFIMRINTNIQSKNTLFTDSNGFQMMRRQYRKELPIQGNYYPMASSAFIEDSSLRMTVLAAQPCGCASLTSGQMEIMLDRVTNQDDNKGIGTNGDDNLETVVSFKIILEKPSSVCRQTFFNTRTKENSVSRLPLPLLSLQANLQQLQFLHPLLSYKKINLESNNSNSNDKKEVSDYTLKILTKAKTKTKTTTTESSVPCDIHLLGAIPLPRFTDSDKMNDTGIFIEVSNQSSLLFHRMGFDQRFKSKSSKLFQLCPTSSSSTSSPSDAGHPLKFGELKMNAIFGDLFKKEMMKTSLSLLHKDQYFDGSKTIKLDQMEIYSFIVEYNSANQSLSNNDN